MYDAVFVLVEAFNKILRKKPDQFRLAVGPRKSNQPPTNNTLNGTSSPSQSNGSSNGGNNFRSLDCNTSKGWVNPWEHGDKISRYLRKVRRIPIVHNFIIKCTEQ